MFHHIKGCGRQSPQNLAELLLKFHEAGTLKIIGGVWKVAQVREVANGTPNEVSDNGVIVSGEDLASFIGELSKLGNLEIRFTRS